MRLAGWLEVGRAEPFNLTTETNHSNLLDLYKLYGDFCIGSWETGGRGREVGEPSFLSTFFDEKGPATYRQPRGA